jgi:hypothetical protein
LNFSGHDDLLEEAGLPLEGLDHGARSGQGSKTAEGGEGVLGLVLDGEHAVIP